VHLKSLHDAGTKTRFVVSGSANAALGMGSRESGAGRFTDFLLPPLTFAEFLNLRDLPSLYGISDVRELNRLFTMLALNTGNEISLDALASKSAVSKNTLKRYMEYLEAVFLIRPVMRVDQKAGRFQRDRAYKVMLTNPSLRTGLFNFVGEQNPALGSLVETAVFAQRFHRIDEYLHYARWKLGSKDQELDMVVLDPGLRVTEAVEVKYTDRVTKQRREWEPWINFCKENGLSELTVTTRTVDEKTQAGGIAIHFEPTAVHAYRLGSAPSHA